MPDIATTEVLTFATVVSKEKERIRAYLYARFGGPIEDCEDAFQQACIECWNNRHLWSPDDSETLRRMLWITSIRRRLDELRRQRRDPLNSPMIELDLIVDDHREESGTDVSRHPCYAKLTERERAILDRYYLEGAKTGDIADELAMTKDAVRHAKRRALGRLRQCLEEAELRFEQWP